MEKAPWLTFALLGAVMAALAGIFAKVGTEGIDSTFATAVRATIGTIYLLIVTTALGKWPHGKLPDARSFLFMMLAGIAGASSWLFQYHAFAVGGMVAKVSAIDKLSMPLTVILAVLFLKGERLLGWNWAGVVLILAGAYLVAYKPAAQ